MKPTKIRKSKAHEARLGQSDEEQTYSPAEICHRFDLPRTTLFRWEEQDEIPKPLRSGKKEERIYKREHFRRIAELVRKKIADEINSPSQYSVDKAYPPLDLAEKLYLLEIVSDSDPLHAVESLAALAKKHRLSEETLNSLLENAREKSLGDPVRRRILELLVEQEKTARDPNQ